MEDVRTEDDIDDAISENRLRDASDYLSGFSPREVVELLERSSQHRGAILFRLLAKPRALEVFELLSSGMQSEILAGLRDEETARLFSELSPDDRVGLMDELPALVAKRLLAKLSAHEQALTSIVLGYPSRSIGRRMSPEYVRAHPDFTVDQTLAIVRRRADDAETIYTIPVTDHQRVLIGVVGLRDLIASDGDVLVSSLMHDAEFARAYDDAESTARICSDLELLAMPIVDSESRLLGILTIDDAHEILREAEAEDVARAGASEPLRRPYLSTSVWRISQSRVVWLLVLAISALLTVQVLAIFEETLDKLVILTFFIPLLTGTGGNTGSQAATTITRSLAVGDVRPRDIWRVLLREMRVGLLLGLLLGVLGFILASLIISLPIGLVIGATLVCICTMAAAVGGAMPLIAKAIHVDPAVFSTPFITTFCDATGLLIYFTIARVVLGI